MALTDQRKLEIMEQALREGYTGFMSDLWAQEDPSELESKLPEPENPGSAAPGVDIKSTVPSVNISPPHMPTTPEQVPNSQALVRSYETSQPGEMPRGENVSNTLEESSNYKKGGYHIKDMIDLDLDLKDINPKSYIYNYKNSYFNKQTGGIREHPQLTSDQMKPPADDTSNPLSFAQYYYQSPKHKERLLESGYTQEQIADRYENFKHGPVIQPREDYDNPEFLPVGSRAYPESNHIVTDYDTDRRRFPNASEEEILAHELSHISTKTTLNKTDEKEILDRSKILQNGGRFQNDKIKTLEVKADLDAFRYLLYQSNIYDAGLENFDSYDLGIAYEQLKNSPVFQRLIKEYTDNDLMWMMNNVASNEPDNDLVETMNAQKGGFRFKYSHGGPHNAQTQQDNRGLVFYLEGDRDMKEEADRMRLNLDAYYGKDNYEIVEIPRDIGFSKNQLFQMTQRNREEAERIGVEINHDEMIRQTESRPLHDELSYNDPASIEGDRGDNINQWIKAQGYSLGSQDDLYLLGHAQGHIGGMYLSDDQRYADALSRYRAESRYQPSLTAIEERDDVDPIPFRTEQDLDNVYGPNYQRSVNDTWAEAISNILTDEETGWEGNCYLGSCWAGDSRGNLSSSDAFSDTDAGGYIPAPTETLQNQIQYHDVNDNINPTIYGPRKMYKGVKQFKDSPYGPLGGWESDMLQMMYDPYNKSGGSGSPVMQVNPDLTTKMLGIVPEESAERGFGFHDNHFRSPVFDQPRGPYRPGTFPGARHLATDPDYLDMLERRNPPGNINAPPLHSDSTKSITLGPIKVLPSSSEKGELTDVPGTSIYDRVANNINRFRNWAGFQKGGYKLKKKGGYSKTGYKKNSPDKNRPFNIIPGNNITMKGVNIPLLGIDNLGNQKIMKPGKNYKFKGDSVLEIPLPKQRKNKKTKLFPIIEQLPSDFILGTGFNQPISNRMDITGSIGHNITPRLGLNYRFKGGGLWANIHAKRKRIASGSGERMRKPGSKGAPTNRALKRSQN
jgi:hypothetical protein|tara:strand:- start:1757 stop:4798 length:3042 start_codon:yes stop_codon:yes gene_type:complete